MLESMFIAVFSFGLGIAGTIIVQRIVISQSRKKLAPHVLNSLDSYIDWISKAAECLFISQLCHPLRLLMRTPKSSAISEMTDL